VCVRQLVTYTRGQHQSGIIFERGRNSLVLKAAWAFIADDNFRRLHFSSQGCVAQMNKHWVLTQTAFDQLLNWLDQDRDLAGRKYEEVRRRLIEIFTSRGCQDAEELADETINRVTSKLARISGEYVGDPARYFYGVAQKIHLESLRRKPAPVITAEADEPERDELEYECLKRCIENISPESRDLILQYYRAEKREKISHRKALAEKKGIKPNALRVRVKRIKSILHQCIEDCLKRKT
jgi:DNA-directed RNA polymerase specialized sigma24 family protein